MLLFSFPHTAPEQVTFGHVEKFSKKKKKKKKKTRAMGPIHSSACAHTVKSCTKAAAHKHNFRLFGAAWDVCKSWVCKTHNSGLPHVKWRWNLTLRLFHNYFKCKQTYGMRKAVGLIKAGPPPLEAIFVIFDRRALIFFCFVWELLKKYETWHHFCAHAQWWSPWRRKNVRQI